jgi:carboxypeptidase family protein
MRTRSLSFLVLLVLLVSPLPIRGQVDVATATVKGTVTDPNGAVIVGATVKVTSVDRGISKTAKTGSNGQYQIPLLQPGTYEIQAEADGFAKAVARDVGLTVGQSLIYDVSLRIGTITNAVEVMSDAPVIQVEQTQQANTINQRQVENLPNINRTMTAAVFTLPGVSDAEATRTQQPGFTGFATTGFSIGGSNGRNNLSTIDGGENEYGSGQYRVFIPVDSIQEFQVNRSSFAAEFGFTVGSSVNIVTKSGTNQLHGSAYGYFRNHATQNNNFIDELRTGQKLYSQNVITGGTIGGPIIKNKLFFFSSYEFLKSDVGAFNFLLNSSSALGINGNSSAAIAQRAYLDQLAASGNPTLVAVAAQLRTTLVPQNDPNLLKFMQRDDGAYDVLTKTHTWLTRVDYQPNGTNSLNFRFELSRGLTGAQSYPDGASLVTRDYSILTNWAHTFGPSLVNQTRVQIVPFNKADNLPNAFTGSIADPSINPPASITIAGFAIGGFVPSFTFGSPAQIPYIAHQRRFQFDDTLSWTTGNHSFKFGASYRPVSYNVEDDLYFAGQFNFADNTYPIILGVPAAQRAAVAGFNIAHGIPTNGPPAANLTGAQSFHFGFPSFFHQGFNNPRWSGWAHYFGAFAQDSWKVTHNLTLDYGFRVDVDGEPPPLQRNAYVSPRLGFAWDPWGDGKTVIRGGAGIFEGPIDVLIPSYGSILDDSGRYINQILPTGTAAAGIYQAGVAAGLLPFGHLPASFINALGQPTGQGAPNRVVFEVNKDYKNPYSVQTSLSIQRQLGFNTSLEVGYLMYHGLHLQMPVELNYKETGVVDPFVGPRYTIIDPTILQKVGYDSRGKSIYHALTVSLNKHYSHGFQFGVNYTFSKTLDDIIDFSSSQTWFRPTRLNLYRAVSVFDFPHIFTANAVYNTPFKAGSGHNAAARMFADITLSPVLTMRSGIPFSIRMPSLANGLTSLDANFATPFAASRDSSRGDAFYALDLAITKSFYIARDRGVRVDFSVVGSNLLNTTNFNKVWDQFPATQTLTIADTGQTLDLLHGPFNLKGFKPTTPEQLSGHPLAFVGVDNPRRFQFGLRVVF